MKRREVIRPIRDEARRQEVGWAVDREGRNHTLYRLGATLMPIPRHAELGERWWRK